MTFYASDRLKKRHLTAAIGWDAFGRMVLKLLEILYGSYMQTSENPKTEREMIRILYFSTARPSVSYADVEEIVAKSKAANEARGITGALAFNGRNFCQVLEGEKAEVNALLETIQNDERHGGFKVIDEKEITQRHFPDWSMQLVDDLDFSAVINAMRA